jgi:hypothetical protein
MAKHISLMARTAQGHKYGHYFIELENAMKFNLKPAVTFAPIQELNFMGFSGAYSSQLSLGKLTGMTDTEAQVATDRFAAAIYGYSMHKINGTEHRYETPLPIPSPVVRSEPVVNNP